MELQKVIIENFKCFQSKTEIEFGKLTLLTGANSSGKSSIIYSILGAIQSGEFPFQFSTNGKYVNMGDFNEIVFGHDKNNIVKLGYVFKNSIVYQIDTEWKENSTNKLPKLHKLSAVSEYFKLKIEYKNRKYIIDFKYEPKEDPQNQIVSKDFYEKFLSNMADLFDNINTSKSENKNETQNDKDFSKIMNEMLQAQDIKGLAVSDLSFGKEMLKQPGGIKLRQIFDVIEKLFKSYDERINFISSFRLHPDRVYLETSKADLKIYNDGKGYLDQIVSWENKNQKKHNELLGILKELDLIYDIKTKRTDGGKYDILIKPKENSVFTSLYDVGFGISQFLPIIVADLQLPKTSTLYVAQPEIHLHPSVQSSFGNYLINQITKNDKRYVIETHSEYLLNKIRLAIVKGEIQQNDVKVIFLENLSDETKVYEIEFNNKGQIVNAPNNFFETYMLDVMNIAINAVE